MGSERYPLLLLLAMMAVHGPVVPADANALPPGEMLGVGSAVVELLRASVQERLSAVELSKHGQQDIEVKRQLAQWYNFPNFNNANCTRGSWKNC